MDDEEFEEKEYKCSILQIPKLKSEPSLTEVKAIEEKITSYPPHTSLDLKLSKKRGDK